MTRPGVHWANRGNYTAPRTERRNTIPIVKVTQPPKAATCNLTLHSKKCRGQHTALTCTRDKETCIGIVP